MVAGCSVGSLVGAAYVNNCLPQMKKWVSAFRYWDVIRLTWVQHLCLLFRLLGSGGTDDPVNAL
nr:hypothetical protein [Candidatus Pantoea persica]